jgi:5-methylcytosine-specific restriction endonuclease McrA
MVPCVICGKEVEPYSCSRKRCTACVGLKRHGPKQVGICAYCGTYGALTRDHVVPKSRGGSRGPENIIWVCGPCNWSKANLTLDEWLSTTNI